ncbi:hypothetical protein PAXRUDRAFT_28801 [Paxillus rubicundulus Ve08.2h10]|uniref:Unplaced genomic scaffold scaffold_2149, whole genome shotgun sequence n=1 Tax=Paxillus rubicundulus Ve08.2h10 TaxID=930991 RepID=A0A0D0DAG8_9AGAM|nr:hypothetical protein PAXRUDRAFT_28801 [Paxillus rubicundulus Ve08.2h10]
MSIQLSGQPRSATVLSDPSTDEDVMVVNTEGVVSDDELIEDGSSNLEEVEVWEDELQESIAPTTEICDWETLHAQIQLDLKKKHKDLPLSQINQHMILSNFAMLRIKGATRTTASMEITHQWHHGTGSGVWFARRVQALARHYQIFKQLPVEKWGGWLLNFKAGEVTPRALQTVLNTTILPNLGINPKWPICEHTAQ